MYSLVQAIAGLLAHVEDHWQRPDYGDRLEQFEVLDSAVYVAARHLGLHDADMPRRDATFHSDEVVFFGRTNVPGCWSSPPDAPSTLMLMATQGWKADMEALRKLALQSETPAPEPATPDAEGGGRPIEQPSIEQQMQRLAQVIGDDNAARILAIAQRSDLFGERKMEEILRLDSRFAGSVATAAVNGVLEIVGRGALGKLALARTDRRVVESRSD